MGNKKEILNDEQYHNTKLLLQQYRMVNFHANLRKQQYEKKTSFDNIPSSKLDQQLEEIKLNEMLLKETITALNNLKAYPTNGDIYYYILYYTYFNDNVLTDEQIANLLNDTNITQDISRSTISRKRKKAIKVFGMILWGFLSKDSPVFQQFLKLIDQT